MPPIVPRSEGLRTEDDRATRAEALAKQLGGHEGRERLQRSRAKARADRNARRARNGFLSLLSLAEIVSAVLAGLNIGTDLSGRTRGAIAVAVLVALGVALGLLRIVIGGSVREWIAPAVARLSARLEQRYLRDLGLD